jgi:nucleoside transporter
MLARLSLMMFLQYFVQGSYLPVVSVYVADSLGFTGREMGYFGAALAVGPIMAPFILGQLVDRLFATERVMAACHFVGGLLMLAIFFETRVWPVILLATIYSVLYVPTMTLTNSLAFQHLHDKELEFPWVRLFGTIGFIIPAFLIEAWAINAFLLDQPLAQRRGIIFIFAGVAGIVMSMYCLLLPHTPPKRGDGPNYAPGIVIGLLRNRNFLVIVLVSFFIGITHKFFFVWNSPFLREILDSGGIQGAWEQRISSIGQVCEVAVMAVLGFGIKRFGFKWTLTLGTLAYGLRCVLFAAVFHIEPFAGKITLACAGQALHGFCFGCFLATGYMYVDKIAPADVRGSMQTLYGTFVIALGFFFGGIVSGWVGDYFTVGDGQRQWTNIWISCAALAFACTVTMIFCFKDEGERKKEETT